MAIGAAKIMLRCVLEGSLAIYEIEMDRRPYHPLGDFPSQVEKASMGL
ncbi:hypothetical protein CCACVL1_29282 [Corchorus capsularis]|uniref:Uncharacterized protein n=1 Tax=Corchorus capsularis TaxID=210143 RepID=A0A1R3G2H3_COCAP|nr:hypothetical protein CCACVL1_29282 [Corchorus capsularis]